jgi:hypothetical protein
MAMSKLTLYADTKVVKRAKKWASERNTSLSAMVDRFLRAVTSKSELGDLPPITKKALGMVKLPDKPTEELLTQALEEKYRVK